MSIPLPPLPSMPGADGTEAQWDRYLRICAMYTTADSADSIKAQTAQMVKMTAAAERNSALLQQAIDQPQATSTGFSEQFVMELLRLALTRQTAGG